VSTPSGRIAWEKSLARIPILRDGFQTLVSLRFARTTALLLRGGLPLVETIRLSGKATGSHWIAGLCDEASDAVKQGATFSHVLSGLPLLGPELGSWVRAGEASGDLPVMFSHASERLRHTWSASMDRAVTLIEPALIILVAVFVLVIALAILLPILSLNQQLA
jgi:type II secretory pathway component PulF